MPHRRPQRATAALVAAVFAACTSTLQVAGQPDIEGKIGGADELHYYVENESGQWIAVPRRRVTDIDQPGNVLAIVGAAGVALSLGGNPGQRIDADALLPLLLFGGLATFGTLQWMFAKSALQQPPPQLPTLPFVSLQEVR